MPPGGSGIAPVSVARRKLTLKKCHLDEFVASLDVCFGWGWTFFFRLDQFQEILLRLMEIDLQTTYLWGKAIQLQAKGRRNVVSVSRFSTPGGPFSKHMRRFMLSKHLKASILLVPKVPFWCWARRHLSSCANHCIKCIQWGLVRVHRMAAAISFEESIVIEVKKTRFEHDLFTNFLNPSHSKPNFFTSTFWKRFDLPCQLVQPKAHQVGACGVSSTWLETAKPLS